MKATEARLLDLIQNTKQFVIPIYQRLYSWREKECRQFWDDIVRCGSNDNIQLHFIGSVVYVEAELSLATHQSARVVIDGQQRLTTLTLLLVALMREVKGRDSLEGFSCDEIKEYYLTNRLMKEERKYRLLLSQTDKDTLKSIIDGLELPSNTNGL